MLLNPSNILALALLIISQFVKVFLKKLFFTYKITFVTLNFRSCYPPALITNIFYYLYVLFQHLITLPVIYIYMYTCTCMYYMYIYFLYAKCI